MPVRGARALWLRGGVGLLLLAAMAVLFVLLLTTFVVVGAVLLAAGAVWAVVRRRLPGRRRAGRVGREPGGGRGEVLEAEVVDRDDETR